MSKDRPTDESKMMWEEWNPETIQDLSGARQAMEELLNLVEELSQENAALRQAVQALRDEVNRLKGEQGQPKIKPSQRKSTDHSSEKERRRPAKGRRRGSKVTRIKIHAERKLKVEPSELPADAKFKGYEAVIIQDIHIAPNNTRFLKEKYYSATEGKTYLAALPAGYVGEFGPGLRALVITLYYGSGMTEPKIKEFLSHFDISISSGQISNLLIKDQDRWQAEKAEVVAAGIASTEWQHIDDTGTRVKGENQYCHILCNPYYTAYFTRPHKTRLTLIHLLQGTEQVELLLNHRTVTWLAQFNPPQWAQTVVAGWPQDRYDIYQYNFSDNFHSVQ